MAVIEVIHHWDDRLGPCYDCGDPSAFVNSIGQRLCSVCAANAAADGDIIERIEKED